MPKTNRGTLQLFIDSTVKLLEFYSQSSLDKTSVATLKLVIEGTLLPSDYQPMSQKQLKSLARYVQNTLHEWPKQAIAENISWFNEHLFKEFTEAIVESGVFKECTSAFEKESHDLRLSIIKRLFNVLNTQIKPEGDVALCLQWCASLNGRNIAAEMRGQLLDAIQNRIHNLKLNILEQAMQEKPATVVLFKNLDELIQKTRDDYLFDKVDDAEAHLVKSLQHMKQELLQTHGPNKTIKHFCDHLDLSEEQRHIQHVFSELYQNVPHLEPEVRMNVILAITNGEFQLGMGNGLNELKLYNTDLAQHISEWKPSISASGIHRFKILFIDSYFKPIKQLFDYYGIDSETLEPTELHRVQASFVTSILKYMLGNQEGVSKVKLNCLLSWLKWYPEQTIAENQSKITRRIINKHWAQFTEKAKETGTFDGFEQLLVLLFNNIVLSYDLEAKFYFYSLMNQVMQSRELKGFSSFIKKHHPQYLFNEAQYWLYSTSDQVLELLQATTNGDFNNLIQDICKNTMTVFSNGPNCNEQEQHYSINDLFSHPSVIQSFDKKFEAWKPKTTPEGIQSFIEQFIEYYVQPLNYNSAWQKYFPQDEANNDLINDCILIIYASIVSKIQNLWAQQYPEKGLKSKDKLICFEIWTRHYMQNDIAQAHARETGCMIDDKLHDFTAALRTKGKETPQHFMIQDNVDIPPKFKDLMHSIRKSFIFKSDVQAEDLLYEKVKKYLNDLSEDKTIKPVDISKLRAAILADKRLSVEREQLPRLSVKHPIQTAHFLKVITTRDEGKKTSMMRKLSQEELCIDAKKKEKRESPKLGRRARHSTPTQDPSISYKYSLPKSEKPQKPDHNISPETARKLSTSPVTFFRKSRASRSSTDNATKMASFHDKMPL